MLTSRSTFVFLSGALLACKMANPAFEGGEETGVDGGEVGTTKGDDTAGEGLDAAEADASADGVDSGDGDEFGDGDSDSAEAEAGDGDDAGDGDEFGDSESGDGDGDSCDLPFGEPLIFKFHSEAAALDCPEFVGLDMRVSGPGQFGGIAVQECSEGCGTCFGEALEIEAYPAQLTDIGEMTLDACIRVNMEALEGNSTTYCEYGRMVVGYQADPGLMTPLVVASSVDADDNTPIVGLLEAAGLLPWAFSVAAQCDCPVDNSDPCCLPENPPSIYKLNAGKTSVQPGESVPFTLLQIPYEFSLWQAAVEDSCGADFETSWMIRPQ